MPLLTLTRDAITATNCYRRKRMQVDMLLHTSYLIGQLTGLSHIRSVAFYCFIDSYTDVHKHPLVDPRTKLLV